ncbi:hypothetical protein NIIDMKKI_26870 [Mycobacterium kansasii]|uniref:Uncharacterized protein n=1 Tax=Mycobacterium kansasii TaxID=1768 RepID=A0A7G1I8Z4_MYCKA|nr:hypothetical protein NIIDMKKI_26870 [Mycobacterium kansasii]
MDDKLEFLLTEDRPDLGLGATEPMSMFTETEIRGACRHFGLPDSDTDSVIEQLKENRQSASCRGRIGAGVRRTGRVLAA